MSDIKINHLDSLEVKIEFLIHIFHFSIYSSCFIYIAFSRNILIKVLKLFDFFFFLQGLWFTIFFWDYKSIDDSPINNHNELPIFLLLNLLAKLVSFIYICNQKDTAIFFKCFYIHIIIYTIGKSFLLKAIVNAAMESECLHTSTDRETSIYLCSRASFLSKQYRTH